MKKIMVLKLKKKRICVIEFVNIGAKVKSSTKRFKKIYYYGQSEIFKTVS